MTMHVTFDSLKTFYNILVQKLKNHRGNWNQNDPTADDYIKNRPFYSEGVKETIIIDTVVNFDDSSSNMGAIGPTVYQAIIEDSSVKSFKIGETYTVIWDGQTYECVAKDISGIGAIGNASLIGYMGSVGYKDTGEPFLIGPERGFGYIIFSTEDGSHTMVVKTITEVVHKLDKKFIDMPDNLITDEEFDDLIDNIDNIDNQINNLSNVAFSGDYYSLSNRPTIYTDVLRYNTTQTLTDAQKQTVRDNIGAGTSNSNFDGKFESLSGVPNFMTLDTEQDVPNRKVLNFGQHQAAVPTETGLEINTCLWKDSVYSEENIKTILGNGSLDIYITKVDGTSSEVGIRKGRISVGSDTVTFAKDLHTYGSTVRIVDLLEPVDAHDAATKIYVDEAIANLVNSAPDAIAVDTTLTQSGQAADAKAVGDAIAQLSGGNVDQKDSTIVNTVVGSEITITDASNKALQSLRIFGRTVKNNDGKLVNAGDSGSVVVRISAPDSNTDVQSLVFSTPNGLPGVPVVSGGNFTDASGQQWICDEIDFNTGIYIQRAMLVEFDGSDDEGWRTMTTSASNVFRVRSDGLMGKIKPPETNYDLPYVLCNGYNMTTGSGTYNRTPGISFSTSGSMIIFDPDYTANDISLWKAHLAEEPLQLAFVLANPVESAISADILAVYSALHTMYPTTKIICEANMELAYIADTDNYVIGMNERLVNGFNVRCVIPQDYGAVADGETDDTAAINTAIKVGNVYLPSGTYLVSTDAENYISVPSNRYLIFGKGAVLKAINGNTTSGSVLSVKDVSNVTIIGATVIGDVNENTATDEGSNHGIVIQNAENIVLDDCVLSDCYTDGVYINNGSHVRISNCKATHSGRNGFSVISGYDVEFDNCVASESFKSKPRSGFAIEPVLVDSVVDLITFRGCKTMDCTGNGFYVSLKHTNNAVDAVTRIRYADCDDHGSHYSFYVGSFAPTSKRVGYITVDNFVSYRAGGNGVNIQEYCADNSMTITFNNLTVANNGWDQIEENYYTYAASVLFENNSQVDNKFGNAIVNGLATYDDAGMAYRAVQSGRKLKNVCVNNAYLAELLPRKTGAKYVNCFTDAAEYDSTHNVKNDRNLRTQTTHINGTQVTFYNDMAVGDEFDIYTNGAGSGFSFIDGNIDGLTTSAGAKVSCSSDFGFLKLKNITENTSIVLAKVGEWAEVTATE